jgi:murein DD-endopeptidase MepM/ murein hydrolase activator NlpD
MNVIPDSPVNELYKASRGMNQVVLQCGDVRVLMGHLLQGSITVQEEDWVQAGQPLGKVGNSGKSKRPHLHIQADKSSGDFDPVPVLFDGMFLVRNSIVVR